ncbi:MAG: hypothetical protein IJ155_07890 [Prevotella sp.]|nr:hypothetical protein [Prevotella sp.]
MKTKWFLTWLFMLAGLMARAAADVTLTQSGNTCTIRNDYVSVYVNKNGEITSFLLYKDGDRNSGNSVQLIQGSGAKGYFSYSTSGGNGDYSVLRVDVVQNTGDVVEVQYVMDWVYGYRWTLGYLVRRNVAGCYNYAIVEGSASARETISEARMGFRGSPALFYYAYVNDDVQATMPTPTEMKNAETVTDATYRLSDGTVYTKYDYAVFQKDDAVHGMMGRQVGVWTIVPSVEWLNGGVMRQDLTVHATDSSPILLRHFHGNHFGGKGVFFAQGQKKLYGPHLIYVNQSAAIDETVAHNEMIADAKSQAEAEQSAWPYSWFANDQFAVSRGTVSGRMMLADANYFNTKRFQVILAQPGIKPMLQGADYQFWAETDDDGYFTVSKVRPGTYSLWCYALDGAATGYFECPNVTVTANGHTDLGTMMWTSDRYGRLLWQIGEANHLSDGYQLSGNRREFGLWEQVLETISFTIGESNPQTDWYYAQTKNGNWFVYYQLDEVPTAPLRLTVATAGAANVKMKVRSNETRSSEGVGVFRPEHDGSVSRSATLAGRDSLVVFDIPVSTLRKGENYLNFNIWGVPESGMGGLMYDCIKLEAKESDTGISEFVSADGGQSALGHCYDMQGRCIVQPKQGIYIVNRKKVIIK